MLLNNKLLKLKEEIDEQIYEVTKDLKKIMSFNQEKILKAFIENRISDFHFHSSTGYGYGDSGREALEKVYADIFNTEDALVRPNIISGTHAIYLALRAALNNGDTLLTLGEPYDTLQKVIGFTGNEELSLKKQGINCLQAPFEAANDYNLLGQYLEKNPKVFFIQRSRGYSLRETLSIQKISSIIQRVKSYDQNILIVVDNCYGEFVEKYEPSQIGADVVAGSLIKNPGGGLAPSGGYIVGKKKIIETATAYLTAPGLGKDMGSSSVDKRLLFQGLFMAPLIVIQALETAIFTAKLFSKMGYEVVPGYKDQRHDIIQTIIFNDENKLIDFCRCIQANSPIDSIHTPVPSIPPGYESKVIMAAGTFVQGASIELSADAPIRKPYAVYLQGSLNAEHGKLAVLKAAENLI